VTTIGIAFSWAHLKLAGIALLPIGKVIVPARPLNCLAFELRRQPGDCSTRMGLSRPKR
jgi:uncharacterized membrane protein YccF (DUF307 family)